MNLIKSSNKENDKPRIISNIQTPINIEFTEKEKRYLASLDEWKESSSRVHWVLGRPLNSV